MTLRNSNSNSDQAVKMADQSYTNSSFVSDTIYKLSLWQQHRCVLRITPSELYADYFKCAPTIWDESFRNDSTTTAAATSNTAYAATSIFYAHADLGDFPRLSLWELPPEHTT